jgi:hypothetical protein
VPNHASHSDSHANGNGVAADPVISPQSSDNISLTMSDSLGSREHSHSVDHINGPEFRWSFELSHGDPEQAVEGGFLKEARLKQSHHRERRKCLLVIHHQQQFLGSAQVTRKP